jgi:hypothetical protein
MATELRYLLTQEDDTIIELAPTVDLLYGVAVRRTKSITSLPLEHGRKIADNTVKEPTAINFSGVVSDMVIAEGRGANDGTPRETWTLLQDMQDRNVLFSLVTELGVYENLLIRSLSNMENLQTGKSLQFKMRMQEVEFVRPTFSTVSIEAVDLNGPAADRTAQVSKGVLNASTN